MAFAIVSPIFRSVSRPKRQCCSILMGSSHQETKNTTRASLDKESFRELLHLYALKVPAKFCNGSRKALKDEVLIMPRVLSVLKPTEKEIEQSNVPAIMVILLKYLAAIPTSQHKDPPRGNMDSSMVGSTPDALAAKLKEMQLPVKTPIDVSTFIRDLSSSDITTRTVPIDYSQWSLDAVLRSLLPDDVTTPTSFETIGHIAHLNLREEHAPYKTTIGQVMIDKLKPRIRTVVNKLQSTGGPYRTFAMEVLAGEDNLETSLKENGCIFRLDFAKVYWNSRLETEHRRIVNSLKPDDILADAFCGIGPFTLPAAKQKKCKRVYANDLNPSSVKYLRENSKLNGLDETTITTSCLCARQFLTNLVRDQKVSVTRVVMNFPSGAPEFLDVFRGLYNGREEDSVRLPLVHCYCFVKGIDDMGDARKRVRAALFGTDDEVTKLDMPDGLIDVREVRDVAPRKRQVCVTFRVPEQVAFHKTPRDPDDTHVPASKRARVE